MSLNKIASKVAKKLNLIYKTLKLITKNWEQRMEIRDPVEHYW